MLLQRFISYQKLHVACVWLQFVSLQCRQLPAPISKYQPTRGQQQATNSSSSQQPAAKYMCVCTANSSQQPAATSNQQQQPAASSRQQQQAASKYEPTASSHQFTASNQLYVCIHACVCTGICICTRIKTMSKTNLNNEMIHLFAKSTNVHNKRAYC